MLRHWRLKLLKMPPMSRAEINDFNHPRQLEVSQNPINANLLAKSGYFYSNITLLIARVIGYFPI